MSEADKRTRAEVFGVSLKVSLSRHCIAAMTRLYGFVKLFEEVREFARLNPASITLATTSLAGVTPLKQLLQSLQDKTQEFRASGSKIYP